MLETYRRKRKFENTPEPDDSPGKPGQGALAFVVQRHAARRLHWDFRLEADGALKSWAVPKGPSMDPKDKRLAVMVEDHPLEYAKFQGEIPAGNYGAGQVTTWDAGTYEPKDTHSRKEAEAAVLKGIEDGKLHFVMHGERLSGEFILTRLKDKPEDWLLMKVKDEAAELSVKGAEIADFPDHPQPMLATETTKAFSDPAWTFELKLDGIRVLASKRGGKIEMATRNGIEMADKFPAVKKALADLPFENFILDGELVLFDEEGHPSFQALMEFYKPPDGQRPKLKAGEHIQLCVFDVLYLENRDLRGSELHDRRQVLETVHPVSDEIRVLDSYPEIGESLYAETEKAGLEGIMAKRLSSIYQSGRRSPDWVKIKKYHSEEFLIGGYSRGQGAREDTFGALLLGQRQADGSLLYVGNCGGGFTEDELDDVCESLNSLRTDTNPFSEKPVLKTKAVWLKPERLAEVRFASWTRDHHLRFPIFLRMRDDKIPAELAEESTEPQTDLTARSTAAPGDADKNSAGIKGEKKVELGQYDELIEAVQEGEDIQLPVEGHSIHLTHLSKAIWPAKEGKSAVTKRDLIRYYLQVAPIILPHLKDRPLSFVRHPNGIEKQGFFQKHPLPGMPDFVQRVKIWSEHGGEALDWILCNDLPSLIWLAQVGTTEIHPWYSRISHEPDGGKLGTNFATAQGLDESTLNYPDFIVFDLDPNIKGSAKNLGDARAYDTEAWTRTVNVALALKNLLDTVPLHAFIKTSGKTGLHVFVPLQRVYDYDEIRALAETFGRQLEKDHPKEVTMVWSVKKRPQAVFFDHNQNVRGKTLAGAFSTRAIAGAPVSFPVSWANLTEIRPDQFDVFSAPGKVAREGDSWADILGERQALSL